MEDDALHQKGGTGESGHDFPTLDHEDGRSGARLQLPWSPHMTAMVGKETTETETPSTTVLTRLLM